MHSTHIFRMDIISKGTNTSLDFSQATWMFFFLHTLCRHLKVVLCSRSLFFGLISMFTLICFFLFFKLSPASRLFPNFHFHLSLPLWKLDRHFRHPILLFKHTGTSNFSHKNHAKIPPRTQICRKNCKFANFTQSDTLIAFVQQSFDSVTNKS